jgi:YHS domain-containing protein
MRMGCALLACMAVAAFVAPAWAGSSCCAARPMASDQPAAAAAEKAAKPQTTCPVMDEPINKEQYVDYQGQRVYFCCGVCKAKFTANPDEYMRKLQADGVELEKTPAQE